MYIGRLLNQIWNLDFQYKNSGLEDLLRQLKNSINKLNFLDAQGIAKEVMYTRQNAFEHRDKSDKQLACILADHVDTPKFS